jgi:hypothetical protein
MNIETYLEYLDYLIKGQRIRNMETDEDPIRYYEKNYTILPILEDLIIKNDIFFLDFLDFVYNNIIVKKDKEEFNDICEYNNFNCLTHERKLAVYYIAKEITNNINELSIQESCTLPTENDELFIRYPELRESVRRTISGNYDWELINPAKFDHPYNDVLIYNGSYVLIDFGNNDKLYSWIKTNYPNANIYLRLKTKEIFNELPANMRLKKSEEDCMVPANPNWIENLKIRNNNFEGASYYMPTDITGCNKKNIECITESSIEKLEIVFRRNSKGNLSGMIEELDHRNESMNYLLGLCVHFDTDAKIDSDWNSAKLNHLDLALNYYFGIDRIKKRRCNDLAHGKKIVNATYRKHLMRIENINFRDIFPISREFISSKCLFKEWIDQLIKK